ncbi:MAG: aldehyde dehydrogenase family protein, partial [Myxococcota bacterium]
AQPGWDKLGLEARRALVGRFGEELDKRHDELARAIAAEAGKPLWEARGEAAALNKKIQIMSAAGLEYTRERVLHHGSGRAVYRPLGVLAVLGPFNFPLHLPNGHIIPGLLTGNTVVIKPSEHTGASMQLYVECAEAAGFPPGVVNLVQGPGPVGATLAAHPGVDAVLFTGSYETGLRIKRATLEQPGKMLALEMGGKNTSIVLDDAQREQAAHEIFQAAFLTAGQRCTATSRVAVHASLAEELIERLAQLIGRVTVGDTLSEDPFMGPLIDERAMERFLSAQQDDEGGRLEAIVRGARTREDLDGNFVTPGLWRVHEFDPHGSHQGEELFGPDVVLYTFETDEQAVEIANGTDYGLAMSVFTEDESRFERLGYELRAGVLNMTRSTVGASSMLPFGGVKKSGNHRPAAVTAGLYTTFPQAQMRVESGWSVEDGAIGALAKLK